MGLLIMVSIDKARVLIVDDEPHIAELLRRYLSMDGYQCVTAPNGESALELLRNGLFDLVLSDIMMPGMSGIDLLNIIRTLFPDVAVLMVTAINDRSTGVLAVELGAYGYVIKPFDRNEILIGVAGALERRRERLTTNPDQETCSETTSAGVEEYHSVKIPVHEFLHLVKSGLNDDALMEKFKLSARSLDNLLDHLMAVGKLKRSDLDQRFSLRPGSVAIDVSHLGFPGSGSRKPVIKASDAAKCIRSGMDDATLMKRYGISAKGLESLIKKLVAAGVLHQWELETRFGRNDHALLLDE